MPADSRRPGITAVQDAKLAEPDPDELGPHGPPDGGYQGPASQRIVTGYGFWIFLLSDFILFSGFYAAYAVLSRATAGGPGAGQLFDLKTVALETSLLLLSSFACGMATLASNAESTRWTQLG